MYGGGNKEEMSLLNNEAADAVKFRLHMPLALL